MRQPKRIFSSLLAMAATVALALLAISASPTLGLSGSAQAQGQSGQLRRPLQIAKTTATACKSDRECASGNCVDGYCCDDKCQGNCRSCALPGHEGTCTTVPDGQDPRRACQIALGGVPACWGACYSGQCAVPDLGTPCGVCAACDGNGRCTKTPPDDDRCGVIRCSGLNTPHRIYDDLRGNRCAYLGSCKTPNDTSTCTYYHDLH